MPVPNTGPGTGPENTGQSTAAGPDSAAEQPTRIRAGSPAAILRVIPVLLGFQPESSLIIVGTDDHNEVKVTMRYDLPEPADDETAGAIAKHALEVLGTQRLRVAVAAGYGPDSLVAPLSAALLKEAACYPITFTDILRLHDGRYWSYMCTRETCCPAEGRPFSPDVGRSRLTQGIQVAESRTALADTLTAFGGITATSMWQATRRAEQHVAETTDRLRDSGTAGCAIAAEGLALVTEMITSYRDGGAYGTDDQLALLSVTMKDMRVRDDAWARMDPSYRAAHQRMWTDMVRRAQPGYIAGPASLLAFVAWQNGNGALANIALDIAQADDPDYSMADMLRMVITAGGPPSLARLPFSPEDVAASYQMTDDWPRGDTGDPAEPVPSDAADACPDVPGDASAEQGAAAGPVTS